MKKTAPSPENRTSPHFVYVALNSISPSPENDTLYRPVNPDDPDTQALAASIREHGVKEPLVLTLDRFILSGHRRRVAAQLAGLHEVPCRMENIRRSDPRFVILLREYNRQREKTDVEKLREEIVSASPEEAYRMLTEHREQTAGVSLPPVVIGEEKGRARISDAKRPFLEACLQVLNHMRAFWPLSLRQVHYQLLNNPPLIHANKPESVYKNSKQCYHSLSDLLTRARLVGMIPMNIITDETRPMLSWNVHQTTTPFVRGELDTFLKGFYRDLQQTQPNHIEILGEKNTVLGILKPVASSYRIPLTIGRGYSSVPPRYEMAERFRKSGKEKLVLLVLSDFDPDGEEICHSFARSMRDDFGIESVHTIKVALTYEQVQVAELPPNMEAKASSANFAKFTAQYGTEVYELEALAPSVLQGLLRKAIDNVMDTDAFNAQIDREKEDAAHLERIRAQVHRALKDANIEE